jgi:hypothetical protein
LLIWQRKVSITADHTGNSQPWFCSLK